jgi:hypothetical protein
MGLGGFSVGGDSPGRIYFLACKSGGAETPLQVLSASIEELKAPHYRTAFLKCRLRDFAKHMGLTPAEEDRARIAHSEERFQFQFAH